MGGAGGRRGGARAGSGAGGEEQGGGQPRHRPPRGGSDHGRDFTTPAPSAGWATTPGPGPKARVRLSVRLGGTEICVSTTDAGPRARVAGAQSWVSSPPAGGTIWAPTSRWAAWGEARVK